MPTSVDMAMLTRAEVWSDQLKEVLQDELHGNKYVDFMTNFPDGDTFTIPSIGNLTVNDYTENEAVKYNPMDTGEFQMTVTEYLSSGTYITRKAQQDLFYAAQLEASFVPKEARAIATRMETDIMKLGMSQTASNLNLINSARHRFVGSGTNEVIALADFAKAKYALKKANVPLKNLTAIVDPTVTLALEKLGLTSSLSYNPKWEGVVRDGAVGDVQFKFSVDGWDIYESNYLADANETIDSVTTAAGKCNLFFSAAPGMLPFKGVIRQAPQVDAEFNKDYQREEYVTTCRYGLKLYRPENLVCILTDTDQAYA